jgi:predicted nucleic acid-binding protein
LVDTNIWSLALRRRSSNLSAREQRLTTALQELIRNGRAQLVGVVRQELLSGIRHEVGFGKLRDQLRAFDDPGMEVADYEEAARINNQCRSRGIAGSAIDFLICAAAIRRDWQIFTTDEDFARYASVIGLKLYKASH